MPKDMALKVISRKDAAGQAGGNDWFSQYSWIEYPEGEEQDQ